MVDKYYVPDISEFHVGFECERNVGALEPNWQPYTCIDVPLFDKNTVIKKVIAEGGLRVKYLDREDIELLGFKLSTLEFHYYNKDHYEIAHRDDSRLLQIYEKIADDYQRLIFDGYIQNKSELKILLKQLGIDGNTERREDTESTNNS